MTIVWRSLAAQEIDHERLWLAVAGAGLFCLVLTTGGVVDVQLPRCVLKIVTGLPCPTCGATRAIMAMTRLDFGAALAMNPLVVAAALAGALYLAYATVVLAWRLPRFRPHFDPRDLARARVAALTVLAANWGYLVVAGR
jgi:hypothetical protein